MTSVLMLVYQYVLTLIIHYEVLTLKDNASVLSVNSLRAHSSLIAHMYL